MENRINLINLKSKLVEDGIRLKTIKQADFVSKV
jgi:hypothetical protein